MKILFLHFCLILSSGHCLHYCKTVLCLLFILYEDEFMTKNRIAELADLRSENLAKWIITYFSGSQKNFVKATGLTQSEISSLINKKRSFGEKKARTIENKANMPLLWLDIDHEDKIINQVNNQVKGSQTNIGGSQYNNNFFQTENIAKELAVLKNPDAKFLTSMPLLSLDDGVDYAVNPEKKMQNIQNLSERVATFIPHSDRTFAIKVPDDEIKNISPHFIQSGDILIIEPKIPPRNLDFVLIGLDVEHSTQRGMLAKIMVNINGDKKIQYSNDDAVLLPENAKVCGVVVEIKRRIIPSDIVAARINKDWSIL